MTMAMASFGEGYRKGLNENNEDALDTLEIKDRANGEFCYVTKEDSDLTYKIIEKRVNSKRMRNRINKEHPEKGNEENLLAMIVNTAFKSGYLKSQAPDEIVKIYSNGDQDKELLINELFNEVTLSS